MRKTKSVKFLPSLILLLIAPLLANLVGCEAHSSFRAAKDKTPPSFAVAKDKIHPSFQGAKKARIIIKEDYGQAKRVSLASYIIKLTSGLLRHTGVEVVREPVEPDFIINIDVKGEALGVAHIASSSLNLWVQTLKSYSGIFWGKLPSEALLFLVTITFPCL